MNSERNELIELENKFWQSMVDEETEVALAMLTEPSYMVSPQGQMKFDHASYRKMAEHGSMVIRSYELGEIDATSIGDSVVILSYEVTQVVAPRGKEGQEDKQKMKDTSTWVKVDGKWQCAMHTETPVSNA